jgi:Zn-dependent protease
MAPGADLARVVAQIAIYAVPILAAIVFHEVAHGGIAYLLGDPTAARHGRLTLNPLPHIDPFGTIVLPGLLLLAPLLFGTPAFVFGYARPVPVDVRRLRRPRRDSVLVALAGPATNFGLAAVSALVLGWVPTASDPSALATGLRSMAAASLSINCLLGVFNLLPIPPLDGGRVLTALLPPARGQALRVLDGIGYVVVLLVLLNTSVVESLVRPVIAFFLQLAR